MSYPQEVPNEEYKRAGKENEFYSDLMTAFLPHPNTKEVMRKTGEDSIRQSLKNLILTNKYERIRDPQKGANIVGMLFENFTPAIEMVMRENIKEVIRKWEPRATIMDVLVSANDKHNTLIVSIIYRINTSVTPEKLDLTIQRVR